ncbi:MAG TPA: S8 family serine peptidase [Gammaproteobacteria bacterium]|nr:S8 family serine peptidase [Gammaproteobacteria bacterium]
MRTLLAVALAVALTACATPPRDPAAAAAPAATAASRQILVTVRQSAALAAGLTGAPNERYLQRRYGPAPTVDRVLSQVAHDHGLRRLDGWLIQSLGVYCEVLGVPGDRDVDQVIAAVSADPRVDLVQRMNLFETQGTRYDDPYVGLQSAAAELDIEDAHQFATGRGVSVAIIDSAVDANHPDLRGRVRLARNLVAEHPLAHDGEVHGTAVAGIIASAANNHEGIIGVAPDVSLAALRACWAVTGDSLAAQCSTFSLARALETALALKPNVINLSLAGPADPLLSKLLDVVIARGIVVVTAQPERAAPAVAFPSSHPQVLAAHSSMEPASSSSPYVVAAPGSEVLTTTPGARYAFLTGNSLAAAHATGVVALLMEREPDLDAERIAAILTATTTHGTGRASINACRALTRVGVAATCNGAAATTSANF